MASTRPIAIPSSERAPRDGTLADQVYEAVLTRVVQGDFPEGARLPGEKSLSEELGVSRPVLRQALRRLRDDGVVYSRQGSGTYVQHQPDRAVLSFAPVGSIADIQRTFEFRAIIDGEAAALAATRWGDDEMAAILAALGDLDRCIAEGALGSEADEAFHLAVCAATDNHYFVSTRASMRNQIITGMTLARSLTLIRPAERLQLVQNEHREVVAALKTRDANRARAAMRSHVENARARIFEGATPH